MNKIKNILVGIDFSKSNFQVLKRALQLSKLKDAKLTIVHAIDKSLFDKYFTNSNNEKLIEKAKSKIEEEIKKINEFNVDYSILVKITSPSNLIIETAKNNNPELILIGVNTGEDFKSKIFGSTSIKTIQNTKLPVLIVKNDCENEYENILAFTDLSEISEKSIRFCQDFFEKSNLKVIHAYKQLNDLALTFYNSIEDKEKIQKEIAKKSEEEFEEFKKTNNILDAELVEVHHGISEILLNKAKEENRDLIVIASHGVNNAGSFFYGSTALYMMENVQSDILIYVPEEDN